MDTETMIREVNAVAEKHKDDFIPTGQTNITAMCMDIIPKLKRLIKYENTGLTPEQLAEIDEEYTKQAKELMEIRKKQANSGWIPADKTPKGDTNALVQVSGRYESQIFDNALELAIYIEEKGWVLENCPDWTSPRIIAWQPLPDLYNP